MKAPPAHWSPSGEWVRLTDTMWLLRRPFWSESGEMVNLAFREADVDNVNKAKYRAEQMVDGFVLDWIDNL